MINKIRHILQQPFVINTVKLSGSNIIMYLLPLIVTPILSRLYPTEAFGEWGVFSSVYSIISIGMFLSMENYIVKAKENELNAIIKLSLGFSTTVVFFLSVIYLIGYQTKVSYFISFPYPGMLLCMLALNVLFTVFSNLCNRSELYSTLSLSNIVQGGSQAALRIFLGFTLLFSINGLILGTTLAYVITTFYLGRSFFINSKRTKTGSSNFSLPMRKVLYTYRNAIFYDAPSSILSFAVFNLPTVILAIYFNKHSIGCFSIIFQLLLLPMSFVGSAIGKVYYQELCKWEGNSDKMKLYTRKIIKFLSIISILPMLFIACGGDKLIVLFLGAKWAEAGNVALCLSLWVFPIILTQPLLPIFRLLNKQRTMLYFDITYFVCGIGTIITLCQFYHNFIVILCCYSFGCFIVKFMLFHKIITLSGLRFSAYKSYCPIWAIAMLVLFIRIVLW